MGLGNRAWLVILAGVVVLVVCSVIGIQFRRDKISRECDWNLKLIAQAVFRDGGLLQSDLANLPALRYAHLCPCCEAPFVYRPFTGPRHTPEEIRAGAVDRMVVWSPGRCPDGKRHVLRESGAIDKLTEDQFQTELRRLGTDAIPSGG